MEKAEDNKGCRNDCSLGNWQVRVCSDHLLTILVHRMRFRLLLANISEGAYNRYAVGQFLVVLVVVLFEQGLADPLPGILTHRTRQLVLIQNHVWLKTRRNVGLSLPLTASVPVWQPAMLSWLFRPKRPTAADLIAQNQVKFNRSLQQHSFSHSHINTLFAALKNLIPL